jgi:hypothetical protein
MTSSKLGGLLDRQVGWFGSLQDSVDVGRSSASQVTSVCSVGEQAPRLCKIVEVCGGRDVVFDRPLCDGSACDKGGSIWEYQKGGSTVSTDRGQGGFNLSDGAEVLASQRNAD